MSSFRLELLGAGNIDPGLSLVRLGGTNSSQSSSEWVGTRNLVRERLATMDARTGQVIGYKGELGDGSDDSEVKDNFRRKIRDITVIVPDDGEDVVKEGPNNTIKVICSL